MFISGCVAGFADTLHFRHIMNSDGLPHNAVTAITQDQMGFIWIGTKEGLSRYDGYDFKVFKQKEANDEMLAHNHITALLPLKRFVWVGSHGGLEKYDPQTGRFMDVRDLQGISVKAMALIDSSRMIVATDAGLHLVSTDKGRVTPIGAQLFEGGAQITLLASNGESIWVGTQRQGLFQMRNDGQVLKHFPGFQEITQFVQNVNGHRWLGSQQGVYLMAQESPLRHFNDIPMQGTSSLLMTHAGKLWIGSRFGLFRMDPKSLHWQAVTRQSGTSVSGFADVSTLFQDRSGVIWIGTSRNGLYLHDPISQQLQYKSIAPGIKITSFLQMDQHIWMSAGNSLFLMDLSQPESQVELREHRLPAKVSSMTNAGDQHIYLGTQGSGVLNYHINQGTWQPVDKLSQSRGQQVSVLLPQEERLWVGTDDGLAVFTPQTGKVQWRDSTNTNLQHDRITALALTHHSLFVGTPLGLAQLNLETRELIVYEEKTSEGLSHPYINHLHVDPQNKVWIATPRGLNQFDAARHTFYAWFEADGLPGDTIRALTTDKDGFLWIATNRGLAKFLGQGQGFQTFDHMDGPMPGEFIDTAVYVTDDGQLFFGGLDGFSHIPQSKMVTSQYQPPVVFTDFLLENAPVEMGTKDLEQPIELTNALELKHDHALLCFQFASLHFASPGRNKYAYIMEGLDQYWHDASDQRMVHYAQLNPGKYRLRVKGTNGHGIWSYKEATVQLLVNPPMWRTGWAITFYVVFVLGLALSYFLWHGRAARFRQEQLERMVALRNRDLEHRNSELRNMNQILRAINGTLDRDALTRILLNKGALLVPRAEKSRFLYYDTQEKRFRFGSSVGYNDISMQGILLTPKEAVQLFAPPASAMGEGIYKIGQKSVPLPFHDHLPKPVAVLSMTIVVDSMLAGFLIFENFTDSTAFDLSDVERMAHLREHAIAAISRVRLIEDLQEATHRLTETRAQLLDAAHLAGRTDTVTNLLHNIGNALNTLNVSATLMHKEVAGQETVNIFGRLAQLIHDHRGDLESFFREDPRAGKIPDALMELFQIMESGRNYLLNELNAISRTMETIDNVVSAERQFATGQFLEEETDVCEVLDNVFIMLNDSLSNDQIKVHWKTKAPFYARIQKPKFIQVVVNIIQNAREAMRDMSPEKERSISISTMEIPGNRLMVMISDTGPGIPHASMKKIFQQGFTTKNDGNGFGLHYCANAMTEMHGEISIKSDPGHGATFVLTLPATPKEEAS